MGQILNKGVYLEMNKSILSNIMNSIKITLNVEM